MSKFENRQEVADKIDWEGGYAEALDYGIKTADMPEGDTELAEAWQKLVDAWGPFEAAANAVNELLEAAESEAAK